MRLLGSFVCLLSFGFIKKEAKNLGAVNACGAARSSPMETGVVGILLNIETAEVTASPVKKESGPLKQALNSRLPLMPFLSCLSSQSSYSTAS
ncbi:hypothetical protein DFH28DRAFT_977824 [Melampsora americana]|nr:hypothetical protein DFH28DRAFT_977824 [Melampsora americana]